MYQKEHMDKKYKPFPTYQQATEWITKNCDTCKRGYKRNRFRCDWERALCEAQSPTGQITEAVAKAIGFLDSEGCDLWECPGWERGRR